MKERFLKWLIKSMSQNILNTYPHRDPGSSIAKTLVTIKHSINRISYFKLLLHNTDRKILAITEAMLIRLRNPNLSTKIHPHLSWG